MSLLHPTLGEMMDRCAILSLKIKYGKAAGKDVARFIEERVEINCVLSRHPAFDAVLMDRLYVAHETIWKLIETSPPELLRSNAERLSIREEIDKLTGEYRGPEKV